jgi:hypothetical protein
MKRIITFILFTTYLFSAIYSQNIEEKERELLKEYKVQTRTNTDYIFTNDKFSKKGRKTNTSVFNEDGRVLENKAFNLKGEVSTIEKYEYDKNGNRTLYERQSLSGEYKKESEYDIENKLIEEYGYDGSGTFRTVLKYDEKNRVLEITYLISDEIDEKRVYNYDDNKAVVEILKNGENLISKVNLSFDNSGQIIKEEIKTLDGKVLESKEFKYNEKGNVISEIKVKNGEFFYEITYEYDTNQNLLTISEATKAEKKFVKKQYKYDEIGRVVEYQWKRNPDDEYNIKAYKYKDRGVCEEVHTYYPRTDYKILTKYSYTFF